ncbi:hypothetical protein [Chryseobacterium oranimense]|uniref:hypothetical protein n=1 Tax=Chryseobacterium oranimense TaxID=421058 RepID=UPI0022366922|nr:hypothetical protein [Chryseobacterium oranimense]
MIHTSIIHFSPTVLVSKLAAGEGAWYFKDSDTLYKIYGQIKCDLPIDINNAYITGLDSSSDMIRSTSGNIFKMCRRGSATDPLGLYLFYPAIKHFSKDIAGK